MEKIEKNLYNKNTNHSMIESNFDNVFSAFVVYIKHSIDNIGFIRYKDYLYAGYDSSFLLEISRKELIKEGFIVEEIYEKEGVHVMRVKNSDIQEAYKFESIIRNNLLPF